MDSNSEGIVNESPVIDGNEVTFIYKGNADTVYLAGDYNRWELEDKMNYHLYFPKGFNTNGRFHIMYALDGSDYLNFSKINLVLDYMIYHGEIPPLVCVLADPGDRTTEYTLYEPHYRYIVDELIPHIESEYVPCKNIIGRSVTGVSWGGLTAIYLAVNTPGTFRRVLSQSGSFWPKDWQIFHMINAADTLKIRFCLQTGTIQDTEEMNDAMVDLLLEKGYTVDYTKYAETHSWFNWKGHLNEGLAKLYGDCLS